MKGTGVVHLKVCLGSEAALNASVRAVVTWAAQPGHQERRCPQRGQLIRRMASS